MRSETGEEIRLSGYEVTLENDQKTRLFQRACEGNLCRSVPIRAYDTVLGSLTELPFLSLAWVCDLRFPPLG